jgi:hypothetical protein
MNSGKLALLSSLLHDHPRIKWETFDFQNQTYLKVLLHEDSFHALISISPLFPEDEWFNHVFIPSKWIPKTLSKKTEKAVKHDLYGIFEFPWQPLSSILEKLILIFDFKIPLNQSLFAEPYDSPAPVPTQETIKLTASNGFAYLTPTGGFGPQQPSPTSPLKEKILKANITAAVKHQDFKGEKGLLNVYVFSNKEKQEVIDNIAKEFYSSRTKDGGIHRIPRNQRLTVKVFSLSKSIHFLQDSDCLIWTGDKLEFQFPYEVDRQSPDHSALVEIHVLNEGVPLKKMVVSLNLLDPKDLNLEPKKPLWFISYSHKDKHIVEKFIQTHQHDPVDIFYDERIQSNADWQATIDFKIAKCDCFILFWSPNAMKSKEIERELNFFLAHKKIDQINPLKIKTDTDYPLPKMLQQRQFKDFIY